MEPYINSQISIENNHSIHEEEGKGAAFLKRYLTQTQKGDKETREDIKERYKIL